MQKFTFSTKLRKWSLFLLVLTLCTTASFSQRDYTIYFQDEVLEVQENINTFEWSQMPDYAKLGDGYFGWVQFYETPTQNIQDAFRDNNLRLINYIPHQTYLFYFPENTSVSFLKDSGVRAIVPVEGRFKMAQDLKNGDIDHWAWDGDKILVRLIHHDMVDRGYVLNQLSDQQIAVRETHDNSNYLELTIPNNCLEDLSKAPYVKWIELITPPSVKDDQRGKGLHRSSWIDNETGLSYTGEGIGVLCRDDGHVGPHIDFEGRINGLVGNNGNNTHGDGVSGIMAGSGNIDPTMRGMAAGATLFVSNYIPSFLDSTTTDRLADGSVQITNSSYSNGCNDGYLSNTVTVDSQIITFPSALHVFSAGNSNGSNCGYGAGNQWGNITGGHKQAKNCITTANTFYDGDLVSSSSRGPATDGRIKPDIAANGQQMSTAPLHQYMGFGGTSGASPGIAGVSAQLYQLYEEEEGSLPNSALIKAALLNTANDAGNVGPDFKFGWGIVNARRAGQLLLDDRYLSDDITQGNTNTHTINVPSGTTQVRFMLYWKDPAAIAGANPALVNDLDLIVEDPSSNDIQPWVLDPTPNPVNLDTPAAPGVDHLNNMEQVLINNPSAGNYTVEVTGFNVPQGPQEYFVVYEIIQENLTLTYPNGGEKYYPVPPQNGVVIHWDAINTTDPFLLEYSLDGGSNWTTITTVPADEYNFDWAINSGIWTGDALVRVTSGSFSDVSDAPFNITGPRVSGITIDEVCPSTATISWNAISQADGYDVYILGDKYMEIVASTSSTSAEVPIPSPTEFWYAVAAKNDADGWVGERTIAGRWTNGEFNCELGVDSNTLESSVQIYPNPASDQLQIVMKENIIQDISSISLTNSLGQVLMNVEVGSLSNNTISLDVSSLSTGLYFVSVKSGSSQTTKKLLVK